MNEGDCDSDAGCLSGMKCGEDNCPHELSPYLYPGSDCCFDPDKSKQKNLLSIPLVNFKYSMLIFKEPILILNYFPNLHSNFLIVNI